MFFISDILLQVEEVQTLLVGAPSGSAEAAEGTPGPNGYRSRGILRNLATLRIPWKQRDPNEPKDPRGFRGSGGITGFGQEATNRGFD